MKNFNNIIIPKYFYYQNIFDDFFIVGNSINSNFEIINKKTLSILLYVIKKGIINFEIIKSKFLDIFLEDDFIKLYKKSIILNSNNDTNYKFSEEILIIGDNFLTDIEKLSVVKNADKVIYLRKENILKNYNKNSIFLGEQGTFGFDELKYCIKSELKTGKNIVLVEYIGNPSFGSSVNDLIKEISKDLKFSYRYIGMISYIDKIYENTFMKFDPMSSGFISIDLKKLLQKNFLDTNLQIIITRIGYLKGLDFVYGQEWKDNLKIELNLLKTKLLEFYKKEDYLFIINTQYVKKIKIDDIFDSINYWIPGYTSIFIDGI